MRFSVLYLVTRSLINLVCVTSIRWSGGCIDVSVTSKTNRHAQKDVRDDVLGVFDARGWIVGRFRVFGNFGVFVVSRLLFGYGFH